MPHFALIGKPLTHSFSKRYFENKFRRERLMDYTYEAIELDSLYGIRETMMQKGISGLNVTIPYKEAIIPYLDEISEEAKAIGAVNLVKVLPDGRWKGYNTDAPAFADTLVPLLQPWHTEALVLGTGGASKAVCYALKRLNIKVQLVSRDKEGCLSYKEAFESAKSRFVIVNCTPVGMFPHIEQTPWLGTDPLSARHLCYDLIYNPGETLFMVQAEQKGAHVKNGLEMLERQAELGWQIWHNQDLN